MANLTDSSTNEYIIGDLQGCELYVFQMYINNNESFKSEETFTSPEQGKYYYYVSY